jgi:hypothetical protein
MTIFEHWQNGDPKWSFFFSRHALPHPHPPLSPSPGACPTTGHDPLPSLGVPSSRLALVWMWGGFCDGGVELGECGIEWKVVLNLNQLRKVAARACRRVSRRRWGTTMVRWVCVLRQRSRTRRWRNRVVGCAQVRSVAARAREGISTTMRHDDGGACDGLLLSPAETFGWTFPGKDRDGTRTMVQWAVAWPGGNVWKDVSW